MTIRFVPGEPCTHRKSVRVDGMPVAREKALLAHLASPAIRSLLGDAANLIALAYRMHDIDKKGRRRLISPWIVGPPHERAANIATVTGAIEGFLESYDDKARASLPESRGIGGLWEYRPRFLHGDRREDGCVFDSKAETWITHSEFAADDAGAIRHARERHRLVVACGGVVDFSPNVFDDAFAELCKRGKMRP